MIRRARLLLQFQIARAFVAPVAPPVPGVLMAAKDLSRMNLYILLVWFSDLFARKPRRTKLIKLPPAINKFNKYMICIIVLFAYHVNRRLAIIFRPFSQRPFYYLIFSFSFLPFPPLRHACAAAYS